MKPSPTTTDMPRGRKKTHKVVKSDTRFNDCACGERVETKLYRRTTTKDEMRGLFRVEKTRRV
ncbi:MAG: hypothetical protein AAB922_00145 [Patescibacteria group bacterium]